MLKLLREYEVAQEFRRRKRTAEQVVIAVPFWGKGAIKSLGLGNNQNVRIICNLGSSACNPDVIADLKKLPSVEVRTHSRLHAKIYATKQFSIVGSSNASTNGLTIEGQALKGWIEANILSDDPALVNTTTALFEKIWCDQETKRITAEALRKAQDAWKSRPKQNATLTARTLLAACRENPKLFSSVFVYAYDAPLDPDAEGSLKQVRESRTSVAGKPGAVHGLGASDFKSGSKAIWGYQSVKPIEPGSWLVDLNCINGDNPTVSGCAQVPSPSIQIPVKDGNPLTLAVRQPVRLNGRARQLRLSSEEKSALVVQAKEILKCSPRGPMPLIEAVGIIDNAKPKTAHRRR